MASQSQNAMNVSSSVSPANGSSGSSTTISVCTTKMQSLTSTPSSQSYQQQSSPSSSPSPSPSPMQQQHQQTLQQPNNIEAIDKNSSNTLKVCIHIVIYIWKYFCLKKIIYHADYMFIDNKFLHFFCSVIQKWN